MWDEPWQEGMVGGLDALPGEDGTASILVIACTDPGVAGVLARFEAQGAKIWRAPGNRACSTLPGRRPLAARALAGVRDVIVMGHSQCGWVREHQPATPACEGRERGMAHILANVLRAANARSSAMQNVLDQLHVLARRPDVNRGVELGQVRLHGWLYLEETGGLLRYDSVAGRFVPMG